MTGYATQRLRNLASASIEGMSDAAKLKEFVKAGLEAADRIDRKEVALRKFANINSGSDLASGDWRCKEAADIAKSALSISAGD